MTDSTELSRGSGLLFVTGAWKTATSPLVALLNAHPDVFVLYEAVLFADPPSKRGREFLASYPEAHRFFRADAGPEAYRGMQAWLRSAGHPYAVFGDKVPTLSVDVLRKFAGEAVVYCVRDVRTWLAKKQIHTAYMTKENVVPTAVSFCVHFLESFRLRHRLHIRTETFVEDNDAVIRQLGAFLGMDLATHCSGFWRRVADHPPGTPKAAVPWWEGSHRTSQQRPERLDVAVRLRPHPFWDRLLAIFDSYVEVLNTEVDPARIDRDVARLERLAETYEVALADAYEGIESTERPVTGGGLGRQVKRLPEHASRLARLARHAGATSRNPRQKGPLP